MILRNVSGHAGITLRSLRRWRVAGVMTVLCLSLWTVCQADDQTKVAGKEPPKKNLWTLKLEHAQKLLAAVAQDDTAMVERSAEELIRISKDLAWNKIRSERYDELSREYRREAEGLIKAAKAKNKEGMALGYVKMSLACFNCHNHVREVRVAGP